MFGNTLLGGINQGFLWAILAIGVYISFRQLDFADLTCEGSFATGGAVAAMLITQNMDPLLATIIAFLVGALAGLVTGLLHTKLKIPPILSGILTMTALYTVNMRIMTGKANVALIGSTTMINFLKDSLGISKDLSTLIVGGVACIIVVGLLYWFFGTEYGASIRATGINEKMARAQGINTDNRKICGLMISNGMIALAGAIVCQDNGYADVTMGVGAIVTGLAAVIIGETIFARARSFWMRLISIVVGSIIYKVVIAFVISIDSVESYDIKLFTAIIVALALSLPLLKNKIGKHTSKKKIKVQANSALEVASEENNQNEVAKEEV